MQKHRADLQGIRAIAVAMVVFYHIEIGWMPGGFVGVDVFFVLSGFLITRLLYSEAVGTGTIDLANFWLRRAKRLLPNAVMTLMAIVAASWLLMASYRWDGVSRDAISAAIFLSNFRFASSATDYFHFDDPPTPVLHFWSLSIEEQFYFVLPIVLFALLPAIRKRSRLTVNTLLATVCLVSFATSIIVVKDSQPAAFFGTHTRVWQLAVGGLLGINFDLRHAISSVFRGALAWLGIALIVYSGMAFSDDLIYPGLYALVPTIGSAILILGLDTRHAGLLKFALSTTPMSWIGNRSYSAYLWHWPIIVFARDIVTMDTATSILLIAVIIIVSHIAYSVVEHPIHKMDIRPWPRWALASCAACAIALASTSATALTHARQPQQLSERANAIKLASADLGANYNDGCHAALDQVVQKECAYGVIGSAHKIVLFGDSHAAQWVGALDKAAGNVGWELRAWTKTSCTPADVTVWYSPKKAIYSECTRWRDSTIQKIIDLNPSVVVLVATAEYSGWLARDTHILKANDATTELQRGMLATIDKLSATGRRIVIVRDNPTMYKGFKDCLATSHKDCGRTRQEALGHSLALVTHAKAHRPELTVLDLTDRACDGNWCPALRGDQVLYLDRHHFTATFAGSLWKDFAAILDKVNAQ